MIPVNTLLQTVEINTINFPTHIHRKKLTLIHLHIKIRSNLKKGNKITGINGKEKKLLFVTESDRKERGKRRRITALVKKNRISYICCTNTHTLKK